MKDGDPSGRNLQERYEQLLWEAAFTELERREMERVEQLMQTPEMQAEIEASRQRMAQTYRRLESRMHRQQALRQLRTAAKVAARVAAAIGLICFLGIGSLTVAMASNDSFRVHVYRLIQQQTDSYMQWDFVEDEDAAFDVPGEWFGDYYPSYIPEGFRVAQITNRNVDFEPSVFYEHPNGEYFVFEECYPGTSANINTENAQTYYTTINGHECFVSEFRENRLIVCWAIEDRFFTLSSWTSREETFKIVSSIQRIH